MSDSLHSSLCQIEMQRRRFSYTSSGQAACIHTVFYYSDIINIIEWNLWSRPSKWTASASNFRYLPKISFIFCDECDLFNLWIFTFIPGLGCAVERRVQEVGPALLQHVPRLPLRIWRTDARSFLLSQWSLSVSAILWFVRWVFRRHSRELRMKWKPLGNFERSIRSRKQWWPTRSTWGTSRTAPIRRKVVRWRAETMPRNRWRKSPRRKVRPWREDSMPTTSRRAPKRAKASTRPSSSPPFHPLALSFCVILFYIVILFLVVILMCGLIGWQRRC